MNWWKSSWFVLVAFIVYMSLKPADSKNIIEVNDKVGHCLAYFTLVIATRIFFPRWKMVGAMLFSFTLSCLLEWLQNFVPGRVVSIWDIVANGTGVLIGTLFYLTCAKWIHKVLIALGIEKNNENIS